MFAICVSHHLMSCSVHVTAYPNLFLTRTGHLPFTTLVRTSTAFGTQIELFPPISRVGVTVVVQQAIALALNPWVQQPLSYNSHWVEFNNVDSGAQNLNFQNNR